MAFAQVKLVSAGMEAMLKSSEVAAAIGDLALEVGEAVEAHESVQRNAMPVVVDDYVTDRAAASVTIAHPGGLGVQAKYGALTQAAGQAGLTVKES